MNNSCMKWREQLLEAALGEAPGSKLEAHLTQCADCAAELGRLRARREKLDALLPLVAAAEPSPDLQARILSSSQATGMRRGVIAWRQWAIVGAAALVVVAATLGWILNRRANWRDLELQRAQALAQWHAPTDVLLQLPGQQLLNTAPRLGDSYLPIRVKEKSK